MARRLRPLLAAVVAFAAAAVGCASAQAGTYSVYACAYPGHSAATQALFRTGSGGSVAACPLRAAGGGAPSNGETLATFRATVPGGRAITISGLELAGSLSNQYAPGGSGTYGVHTFPGDTLICSAPYASTCSGNPFPLQSFSAGQTDAGFLLRCEGGCGIGEDMSMAYARLVLSESAAPIASLTGGSLLGAGAQTGSRTLTWTASDAESGVARVRVDIGGTTVYAQDLDAAGTCAHDSWNACPTSRDSSAPVSIDTTQAPNGTQTLTLAITDAAGNVTTDTRSVQICNACSAAGGGSGGSSGGGGTGGSGSVTPNPAPVASAPGAQVAAASPAASSSGSAASVAESTRTLNGMGASVGAQINAQFAANRSQRLLAHYGEPVPVTGRLLTVSGLPIGGALIDALTASRVAGATFARESTVRTNADGTFHYVAPPGGSRLVRFAYRTFLEDGVPAAASEIDLRVIAKVRVTVDPHHTRNGHTIRFRGTVSGVPNGLRHSVEMQARVGKQWVSFGTPPLKGSTFTHAYRFTRTYRRQTYKFRAVVRGDAKWPYETGGSNVVKVTVRP